MGDAASNEGTFTMKHTDKGVWVDSQPNGNASVYSHKVLPVRANKAQDTSIEGANAHFKVLVTFPTGVDTCTAVM